MCSPDIVGVDTSLTVSVYDGVVIFLVVSMFSVVSIFPGGVGLLVIEVEVLSHEMLIKDSTRRKTC